MVMTTSLQPDCPSGGLSSFLGLPGTSMLMEWGGQGSSELPLFSGFELQGTRPGTSATNWSFIPKLPICSFVGGRGWKEEQRELTGSPTLCHVLVGGSSRACGSNRGSWHCCSTPQTQPHGARSVLHRSQHPRFSSTSARPLLDQSHSPSTEDTAGSQGQEELTSLRRRMKTIDEINQEYGEKPQ